jgi:hypothetical protein
VRVYYPEFDREGLVGLLKTRLRGLSERLPLRLVSLFGSYAKGNYTAASDVDVLVVYEGPERQEAYATVWKALGIPRLQLHLYTAAGYEELKRSGSSLPREAERGVILWGGGRDEPVDRARQNE